MPDLHKPAHPVRLVTASSLFDGHDASINIMRRIFQSPGRRGDPPRAQPLGAGGRRRRAGGGRPGRRGVVVPGRAHRVLRVPRGVAARPGRRPHQGRRRGRRRDRARRDRAAARLRRHDLLPRGRPADGPGRDDQLRRERTATSTCGRGKQVSAEQVLAGDRFAIARADHRRRGRASSPTRLLEQLRGAGTGRTVPVLGITGTGGSGKSSLTDELVRRFRVDQQDKLRVAVLAVDPTRRRGGGALLGDRIRMNSLDGDRVFFRSLATRGAHELPAAARRRDRRRARPPASTW